MKIGGGYPARIYQYEKDLSGHFWNEKYGVGGKWKNGVSSRSDIAEERMVEMEDKLRNKPEC